MENSKSKFNNCQKINNKNNNNEDKNELEKNEHYDNNEENNDNNNYEKFNRIKPIGLKNFNYEENEKSCLGKCYRTSKYYGNKRNTGNICYINSSIQCLFHLKDFADKITNFNKTNKMHLINATSELINGMKKNNEKNKEAMSVEGLKNVMGKIDERYYQNNQEDANEFISNFLEGL